MLHRRRARMPSALTRLAQLSRRSRATTAPSTLSRRAREGTKTCGATRLSHCRAVTRSAKTNPLAGGLPDMNVQKQTHCFACQSDENIAVSRNFLDLGESVTLVEIGMRGAPPPSGEDALRLSPVWRSCRAEQERQLRHPPSLAQRERGRRREGRVRLAERKRGLGERRARAARASRPISGSVPSLAMREKVDGALRAHGCEHEA